VCQTWRAPLLYQEKPGFGLRIVVLRREFPLRAQKLARWVSNMKFFLENAVCFLGIAFAFSWGTSFAIRVMEHHHEKP
jgi:hypothetical protein